MAQGQADLPCPWLSLSQEITSQCPQHGPEPIAQPVPAPQMKCFGHAGANPDLGPVVSAYWSTSHPSMGAERWEGDLPHACCPQSVGCRDKPTQPPPCPSCCDREKANGQWQPRTLSGAAASNVTLFFFLAPVLGVSFLISPPPRSSALPRYQSWMLPPFFPSELRKRRGRRANSPLLGWVVGRKMLSQQQRGGLGKGPAFCGPSMSLLVQGFIRK